ncbi:MAG: LuxR C-terminal-related transcriptional regulator [Hyphomicrobiaceae bacterium]
MSQSVIKFTKTSADAPGTESQQMQAGPEAKTKHSIVIADKSSVVRAGLRDVVQQDGRFEVVDVVSDGSNFIKACAGKKVEIGIVGWAMPDMSGADVLGVLKQQKLPTRVIVYTGDNSPVVLRKTVKAGAWGFVYKGEDSSVLMDALRSVASGRLSLPFVDIDALTHDPLDTLTARELELLGVLAKGWTNEQIASRIGISHNTVKYHLKNLYEKLSVKNRAMAVALYMTSIVGER